MKKDNCNSIILRCFRRKWGNGFEKEILSDRHGKCWRQVVWPVAENKKEG